MISRRYVIAACLAALALPAAPPPGLAQTPVKAARIGVLLPGTPATTAYLIEELRRGLREHGYVESQNLVLERRYGEGKMERLPGLAAELVKLEVDVIVVATDVGIRAVRSQTQRIPIVMANSSDPVGIGFVASLARPGGNVTGLTYMQLELVGKRLELLKEVVPGLARVAFLWTPEFRGNALELQEIQAAGRALGVEIRPVTVPQSIGMESTLAAVTRARVDALILSGPNPAVFVNRKRIAEFAVEARLPVMAYLRVYVAAGSLIGYGPNNAELFRRAATYVDKILKGAKPADLPVERPSRFELVVNLKTAKALGITIPRSILLRADEVIE